MTGCEEVPEAVVAAERGTQAWQRVVVAQRAAPADHGDFYFLAGELVATLRALESLVGVLVERCAGYGQGRVLRDDAGEDPVVRLADAVGQLVEMGQAVSRAEWAASRFWSAIGHIGVEPADTDVDDVEDAGRGEGREGRL